MNTAEASRLASHEARRASSDGETLALPRLQTINLICVSSSAPFVRVGRWLALAEHLSPALGNLEIDTSTDGVRSTDTHRVED
jgi:hypothetical protein